MIELSATDAALLNRLQHGFPLVSHPFREVAQQLGLSEEQVVARLQELERADAISRLGAVFTPNKIGVSTLAALAVPEADVEEVANIVSAEKQVNHNYLREHHYNLWFVVTSPSQLELNQTLARIERRTGLHPLNLPMEQAFHIDLGFPL